MEAGLRSQSGTDFVLKYTCTSTRSAVKNNATNSDSNRGIHLYG